MESESSASSSPLILNFRILDSYLKCFLQMYGAVDPDW
jgi:hypothetical protein